MNNESNILVASTRVLVIEDDEHFRAGVVATLRLAGCDVTDFGRAGPAMRKLTDPGCDIVLTDLRLPDMDGLAVLAHCLNLDAELPVVVMTGHGDVDTAVRAIKQGAYDFIEKPFGRERLVTLIQRAARQYEMTLENRALRHRLAAGTGLSEVLCGQSAGMRATRELILRIAPTPVDVLVCGETGTGKELVARALHDFSGRAGPLVPINCAALPEALIESELFGHETGAFTGATKAREGLIAHANRGTLFLDEIEAMPGPLQAKLLRVLQEREVVRLGSNVPLSVDVRVVAASNADLAPLIAARRFRADLYYRLSVVTVQLLPLRERRDDIPGLFEHFRRGAALRFARTLPELPPEFANRMIAHSWPGNVRELKSAAERQVLGLPALPEADANEMATGRSLQATLCSLEAMLLEDALRRCKGNIDEVCSELDLAPATLYRKLKTYGLRAQPHREN